MTTTTPARPVPTRRVSFPNLDDLPKHFARDGDLVSSHVIPMLSAMFPDGEDFFVRSVRHFRDQITDPELKKQVAGFIGQEAIHGREHREVNERFAQLGYPTKGMERVTERGLRVRERIMPPKSNLAATAALEHYTATLAELLLSDPEARAMIGHPEITSLFLWHALEESEHKAVAFDVYRAVGGSERMRVWTMRLVNVGFVSSIIIGTVVSILRDPVARRSPRRVWRSVRRFVRSPLVSRQLVRRISEYNRPGFHPDDRDTTALVARWREELFGETGSLRDRLPAAS